MVDEKIGIAKIVEKCIAKGPVEWDALNRLRAKGVVTDVRVDGTTLIMDVKIGEEEVRFGPVAEDIGGQALKSLKVEGDEVHTTWLGLAGASLGVGACLPQSKNTIKAIYPDLKNLGGRNQVEVTLVTKKMERLIIGLDDTDTKEKGASWPLALRLMSGCPYGEALEHRIIQLYPGVPEKTTSCVSIGISLALEEKDIPNAKDYAFEFIKKHTLSQNTCMTSFTGLKIPDSVVEYGLEAKREIKTIEEAVGIAKQCGVEIKEVTGKRGAIGAVAAIGCFDLGLEAAGVPQDSGLINGR
jgi:methanogenesis imperfect marker protein 11